MARTWCYPLRVLAIADPFIQNATNLQNYNRYAYVTNNPLTLTDVGGGKFGNGAITGAYGYLFNQCAHTDCSDIKPSSDISTNTSDILTYSVGGGGVAGVGHVGLSIDAGLLFASDLTDMCIAATECHILGPQAGWGAGMSAGISQGAPSSGRSSSVGPTYYGGQGFFGSISASVDESGNFGAARGIIRGGVGTATRYGLAACTQWTGCLRK